MYSVELQETKDEVVPIKVVTKGVGEDKSGNKSCFPLKNVKGKPLPCLKVKISNGDTDHRFEVRWSNYYDEFSDNPGKFKLVKINVGQPKLLYVTDGDTGRKLMRNGNPVIDYMAMLTQYGTEAVGEYRGNRFIRTGWEFGKNQPFEETVTELAETQLVDGITEILTEQFGEELAVEVTTLFVEHPLFFQFFTAAVAA